MRTCSDYSIENKESLAMTPEIADTYIFYPLAITEWHTDAAKKIKLQNKEEGKRIKTIFYSRLNNDMRGLKTLFFTENMKISEKYIFVCVDGKKNMCCSKYGINVLTSLLNKKTNNNVFACSHLGGCRFATNVISFPSGEMFGRLREENAEEFLQGNNLFFVKKYYRGNVFSSLKDHVIECLKKCILLQYGEVQNLSVFYKTDIQGVSFTYKNKNLEMMAVNKKIEIISKCGDSITYRDRWVIEENAGGFEITPAV
ncbi:hypothetical protein COB57_03340 [Candidatus Peregrinibacteria bacterium]|nr:MAG: hypothetical protein COB57_03340 [Candidatus Peregrinibacteria bacterium]